MDRVYSSICEKADIAVYGNDEIDNFYDDYYYMYHNKYIPMEDPSILCQQYHQYIACTFCNCLRNKKFSLGWKVNLLLLAIQKDVQLSSSYYTSIIKEVKKTGWVQNKIQKRKLRLLEDYYSKLSVKRTSKHVKRILREEDDVSDFSD
jgi:hypothetical protein